MLVLTRCKDEKIVVGDPLNPLGYVTVVDIRGDRVRLGFEFPTDTQINREEVAAEVKAEKEHAAEARRRFESLGIAPRLPIGPAVRRVKPPGVPR